VFTGRVYGPCTWTRVPKNYTRVHGRCIYTGNQHGPWTRVSFFDTRVHGPCPRHVNTVSFEHGPWTRVVRTEIQVPFTPAFPSVHKFSEANKTEKLKKDTKTRGVNKHGKYQVATKRYQKYNKYDLSNFSRKTAKPKRSQYKWLRCSHLRLLIQLQRIARNTFKQLGPTHAERNIQFRQTTSLILISTLRVITNYHSSIIHIH